MYSLRLVHLLLVALGFVAAAQATFLQNADTLPNGGLQLRQAESSGEASESPTADPTPSDNASEPSPTPSEDPQDTTTTQQTTTTTDPATTTSEPSPSETSPSPSDPASSPSTTDGANTDRDQSTTDSESEQSQQRSTRTTVTVIVSTDVNGDVTSFTSDATIITTPGLSPDNDDSGGGGMPTQTRNIVIGVVCGVGGAIILGALGFVAWRVWGRKKRAEENDGLMDYHTAGSSAFNNEPKPDAMSNSTGPSRSPFQTTLEDYHRPGQVNASSNF